ncbi:hypothetical protein LguiA_029488 [Lonicera macranthoides]
MKFFENKNLLKSMEMMIVNDTLYLARVSKSATDRTFLSRAEQELQFIFRSFFTYV